MKSIFLFLFSTVYLVASVEKTIDLNDEVYILNDVSQNSVKTGSELEVQNILKSYKEALINFKNKKYESSYELLNKLFEQNLDNANISFYLGKSAYELKKYTEAIVAFDRVLFHKPDLVNAKLEIARAYIMLNNFKNAKDYLMQIVYDPHAPSQIVNIAKQYLDEIEKNEKKNFLSGIFLFGLNYDTNVNFRSKFDLYDELNNLQNDTNETKSWAHQEVLILNHKYNYDDSTVFKNELMAFSKDVMDDNLVDKDIKMVSYTPSLTYKLSDALEFNFAFFVDKIWLDDESYLNSYGFFPKVNYKLNNNITTRLSLKYQNKKFEQQKDKLNDSYYYDFSNDWIYIFNKKLLFGLGIGTSTEKAKDKLNTTSNTNKKAIFIKTDLTYILNDKFTITPRLSFKNILYDKVDGLYKNYNLLKKREDKEFRYSLTGTYNYDSSNIFQSILEITDNKSNLKPQEYDKQSFTIQYIRIF